MFARFQQKGPRGRMACPPFGRGTLGGVLVAVFASALVERPAMAIGNQEPQGINLGLTSFYDGFGRNEEGFVYLGYLSYAEAHSINGSDGTPVKSQPPNPSPGSSLFNNPRINAFLFVNQLVYVVPEELFGGWAHLGFDFLLPIVGFATSFEGAPPAPGIQLKDNGTGVGDLAFGPLLQFKPIVWGGRAIFSGRAEADIIVPTGAYNPDKDINQGSNFASLNPYVAFTALPIPGLELSARLHYLYNFVNRRPAYSGEGLPPSALVAPSTAQAGQAFWVNFAASYEIVRTIHLGMNGYYFTQFNDDTFTYNGAQANDNGSELGDPGRATFLAIGPGVFWDMDKQNKVFANAYFSVFADSRPDNNEFILRYIHSF
jgi:hypothetical protein